MRSIRYVLVLGLIIQRGLVADPPAQNNQSSLKAHGLVQAWVFNDTTLPSAWLNFRVRRAQISLSGEFTDKARWFISIDAAKRLRLSSTGALSGSNDNSILEDAGAAFTLFDGVELVLGQFRIPTIAEGLASDGELLMPERSLVSRTLGYQREPGAMLSGVWGKFSTQLMASNGNGTNVDDNNNSKSLSLRMNYEFKKGNSLGAFGSLNNMSVRQQSLWGLDYNLHSDPWAFRLEGGAILAPGTSAYGAVTEVAYFVTAKLQPVLRLDFYNPNSHHSSYAENESLGLNYYVAGNNAKIQASASSVRNLQGSSGTPEIAIGKPRATILMLSFTLLR